MQEISARGFSTEPGANFGARLRQIRSADCNQGDRLAVLQCCPPWRSRRADRDEATDRVGNPRLATSRSSSRIVSNSSHNSPLSPEVRMVTSDVGTGKYVRPANVRRSRCSRCPFIPANPSMRSSVRRSAHCPMDRPFFLFVRVFLPESAQETSSGQAPEV